MAEVGIRWCVMFQKEELDIEAMKEYFIENGSQVEEISEQIVELADMGTEDYEKSECVLYLLYTPNTMFVPFKIKRELNLKETNEKYVFMPVAKAV